MTRWQDDKAAPTLVSWRATSLRLERAGTTATSLTSCGQRIIRQFVIFFYYRRIVLIPHYTHQCSRAGQWLDNEPWVRLSSRWSSMFCRRRFSLVRWGQLGGAVIKIVRFLPAANMKGGKETHKGRGVKQIERPMRPTKGALVCCALWVGLRFSSGRHHGHSIPGAIN